MLLENMMVQTWRQQSAHSGEDHVGHIAASSLINMGVTSAKNISVRAEWLRQCGCAPSDLLETPRGRIAPRPASTPRVALHIARQSLFDRFLLLCRSSILNERSGVVANSDHTSVWVH